MASACSSSPNLERSFLPWASSVIKPFEREELFAGKKIAVDKYFSVIINETPADNTAVRPITMINGFLHLRMKYSKPVEEKSLEFEVLFSDIYLKLNAKYNGAKCI